MILLVLFANSISFVQTGIVFKKTWRVSLSSSGVQANGTSHYPRISADGRFVAFVSSASNLVEDDTNGFPDVFVHDRLTGITKRISVSSNGTQGNAHSFEPSISGDGRFIAFTSGASTLVPDGEGIFFYHIFLYDSEEKSIRRVSISDNGLKGNGDSMKPAISSSGLFIAFHSSASNLVNNDTNGKDDVFVHHFAFVRIQPIEK